MGPDKDGVRAIDLAIAHSNEEILARLLKKGAKLGPTTWAMAKGKPRIALVLLNKLLEDGNVLFRKGRLTDVAYRYEYALRRLPRLRPDASSTTTTTSEDIFAQMKRPRIVLDKFWPRGLNAMKHGGHELKLELIKI